MPYISIVELLMMLYCNKIMSVENYLSILSFEVMTVNVIKFNVHVLNMILNCIWLWGSNSGALDNMESPLHCHYSLVHSDLGPIYLSNRSIEKLLILDTWNHITVWKLFVLRIITWSYRYSIIIISCLKPYNCLQKKWL